MLYEILVILAVGGLASGMRAWLFQGAAERVMARLRSRLFSHLMGQGEADVGLCAEVLEERAAGAFEE